ncbi:MAG: fibronectin type III-like domain-contianing protein, partial [Bacteroidales bacterium]|nr:fibronectin type III-like domain-contianing protein [Bacteroidales bacterium]
LAEGGSTTINIAIPVAQLAKWDDASGKLVVPTGTYTIFVGSSSEDEAVKAEFEVK